MTDGPISMLNVLWFKPDGGAERYREYLEAAGPILARHGGRKRDSYLPEKDVIGELGADLIFVVDWPSRDAFRRFAEDPEFQAIHHLREEAITKSLLVRCRRIE